MVITARSVSFTVSFLRVYSCDFAVMSTVHFLTHQYLSTEPGYLRGARNRMERKILPHPSLHGIYSSVERSKK